MRKGVPKMDIETIKKLMKEGDIPQARSRLKDVLSKTPEDSVAQMLYGTCCQLMGDSATFGRIYHDLAPEMAIRVAHGERSDRVSLWLKYAAMFAMLLMCGSQLWATEDYCATFDDDDAQAAVMSAGGENGEFGRVMKMTPRDRLLYFLERPEVSRELRKGNARAIFIPLRKNGIGWYSGKGENLMLIRAKSSEKTGAEIVKAFEEDGNEKCEDGGSFAWFSPFAQVADSVAVESLIRSRQECIKSQEERVRRQEAHIRSLGEKLQSHEERVATLEKEQEERVRSREERIKSLEDALDKRVWEQLRGKMILDQEECIRRLSELEEQIQAVEKLEGQRSLLIERRNQDSAPVVTSEIDEQLRAIDEQLQNITKAPRRRVMRQVARMREDAKRLAEQVKTEREKSETDSKLEHSREIMEGRRQFKAEYSQIQTERRQLESERAMNATERKQIESYRRQIEWAQKELDAQLKELGSLCKQAQLEIENLRNGEMIPSRYNLETLPKTLIIALQDLQEHGEIADLILSSDASGSCVLGITDMVETNNSARDDYERVLKMSPRERMLYFLGRPEVSRELQKGAARAVIIPLQVGRCGHAKADNVVLIRVSSELKTGADVVAALKSMDDDCSKKAVRKTVRDESWYDDDEDDEDYHREKTRTDGILVQFSPFERVANPQFDDGSVLMFENKIRTLENRMRRQKEWIQAQIHQLRRRSAEAQFKLAGIKLESLIKELKSRLKGGEMLPSAYEFGDVYKNPYHVQGARKRVFETIEEHGDISDLIISSDDAGSHVIGVSYVNIYGAETRTKYAGPRDYGDRFPKYVIAPDGKVLYELTEEMVREEFRKRQRELFF